MKTPLTRRVSSQRTRRGSHMAGRGKGGKLEQRRVVGIRLWRVGAKGIGHVGSSRDGDWSGDKGSLSSVGSW